MKKAFSQFLFVMALSVFLPKIASATEYECFANDAIQWTHGKLSHDKSKFPASHTHLRFDTSSQKLWSASARNTLLSPRQMKIIQQGPDDNWDLIAIYMTEKTDERSFGGASVLIIRAFDKSAGLIFNLYEGGTLIAGKCKVSSP